MLLPPSVVALRNAIMLTVMVVLLMIAMTMPSTTTMVRTGRKTVTSTCL